MYYTLTLNPSLDYLMQADNLVIGETNRSRHEALHFGGKGINVSYVLKQLGIDSVCLGFVAGFTGKELENMLVQEGMKTDFVYLDNCNTRINVKLKCDVITEINANGIVIDENSVNKLFSKLDSVCDGDTLILCGSVPRGAAKDIYAVIMERMSHKNVRFVVDTTGEALVSALKFKPFLVKPNLSELCEIAGKRLETIEEIADSARYLQSLGAVNVLVSMGENGAVLVDEHDKIHVVDGIKITAVSTVGAGDSMVAGFTAGIDKGSEYALKLANACGAATCTKEKLATREDIFKIFDF